MIMLRKLIVSVLTVLLSVVAVRAADAPKKTDAGKPAEKKKPTSNLDLWLREDAKPAAKGVKTVDPVKDGRNPFKRRVAFRRVDALPGVLELSDGKQMPGGLYTTREKDWEVYVTAEKRWRRVPFITVLSITAVVLEEKMVQRWRWKGMGEPERVYTGKEYPFRRFAWKLYLIDGSTITGAIKGQPLWVEPLAPRRGRKGPFVVQERFTGPEGSTLEDYPYIKKVVISRTMMDKVVADQAESKAKDAGNSPSGGKTGAKGSTPAERPSKGAIKP